MKTTAITAGEQATFAQWKSQLIVGILFFIVCVTWGTTWIAIKLAVVSVPPVTATGLRFIVAFPLLVLIARLTGEPLAFPPGQRGFFFFVTFAYFTVPYVLINAGEQWVSSGMAALLFSTMPVFTVIFSAWILEERIQVRQIGGIVIGFTALAAILIERGSDFSRTDGLGAAAILGAAVLHALCYVVTKKRGGRIGVVTFNTLPIGVAGLLMTLTGFAVERPDLTTLSPVSLGALAYLGIIASVGGFLAYFHLLKRCSPILLSFIFLIFPVFAVLISTTIEGQPLTPRFIGLCVVLLAAFALTRRRV